MSSVASSGSDSEPITVREASPNDAEAISAIYNYYVLNSSATLQHEIEATAVRRDRIVAGASAYPTLVAESGTLIIGFGALMPFRPREGWVPTVEDSVYVHPDWQRKGIGRRLLDALIRCASERGYHSIVAAITADQEPSLMLHQSAGFAIAGIIVEGGVKFGNRYDVLFLQRML